MVLDSLHPGCGDLLIAALPALTRAALSQIVIVCVYVA
jgi:hypothetical protein